MNGKIQISLKVFFLACLAVSLIIFGLLRLRLLYEYPLSSSVAAVNRIADESYNKPEYRINEAEILRTMSLLKEEFKTLNVTRFTDRILRTRMIPQGSYLSLNENGYVSMTLKTSEKTFLKFGIRHPIVEPSVDGKLRFGETRDWDVVWSKNGWQKSTH
jgi:hypothetical protein